MSKIQLNLLPDIKLEYNKVQHTKKLVLSIALLASSISLAIFILMLFTVFVVQREQLNSSGKAVDDASQKLTSTPQINQIITVQNQLKSLSQLHKSKHMPSRIYDYLHQLTPGNVSISSLDLDLTTNNITISGKAASQSDVNSFIDTLKATTYKVNSGDSPKPAFTSVVQSSFSISGDGISYTVTIQFDPTLFANTTNNDGKPTAPTLTVNPKSGSGASGGGQ